MNTTVTEETILKTDVLGRVKMPQERREVLLDEFEKSGLSGQKFAALVGVKYPTFAAWAQKRRRARGAYRTAPRRKAVRWLEAVVGDAPTAGRSPVAAMVLQLPGGVRLEVADERQAALAAALLRALAKAC